MAVDLMKKKKATFAVPTPWTLSPLLFSSSLIPQPLPSPSTPQTASHNHPFHTLTAASHSFPQFLHCFQQKSLPATPAVAFPNRDHPFIRNIPHPPTAILLPTAVTYPTTAASQLFLQPSINNIYCCLPAVPSTVHQQHLLLPPCCIHHCPDTNSAAAPPPNSTTAVPLPPSSPTGTLPRWPSSPFPVFSCGSPYSLKYCQYASERIVDIGQPTWRTHPELLREGEITPGIPIGEYLLRRKKLIELLPEKSLSIIASAPVKMMTDVVPYSFRQDADYFYLTGCLQPGGVAVINDELGLCMFMPDPDSHGEAWQGPVAGVDAAMNYYKADKAYPMSKLQHVLPEMIAKVSKIFHNTRTISPSYIDLESFRNALSSGKVKDISHYTHEIRWIKSPCELKLMRQSASIACQSLLQTMLFSRMNPEESKLSARIEYECKIRGAQRMAFNPVVGGGANGSVIHYSRNDQKVQHGDFVLMDVGCEFHGYLSDLTRTWPPCGSFSSFQEALYDLILEINKECIKLCKPGATIQEIHDHSVHMLRKGFKQIGILKDERSYAYFQLNPTSIGHYLGMDVHDCASVSNNRPLQPGVVITIEPGVYIPKSFNAPESGIGIRIEDEVLITETGHEVLTASMPKEISHIKSLLSYDGCRSELQDFRATLR